MVLTLLRYTGIRGGAGIYPSLPQAPWKKMPVGLSGKTIYIPVWDGSQFFESLQCQFWKCYHRSCHWSATGLRQQNLFPTWSLTYCGLGRAWPCSPTEPESLTDQKSPPPHRRSHPEVWRRADETGSWAVWEPSGDREPPAPVGAHQQWRGRWQRHS